MNIRLPPEQVGPDSTCSKRTLHTRATNRCGEHTGTETTLSEEKRIQNFGLQRNWRASIQLGFDVANGKTVMSEMRFDGPLRVQRPFYPEGAPCHVYLLHPPGGMVSGDSLKVSIDVGHKAHALLTTPSAGKIYGADSCQVPQSQEISIRVEEGGICEWLPQENIVFNRANANLETRISLAKNAGLIAWDLVALGRPEGEHWFTRGSLQQSLSITREERPLVIERFVLDDDLALMESQAGLMGMNVYGSMYLVLSDRSGEATGIVDDIRECLPDPDRHLVSACTYRNGIISLRALAMSAQTLRLLFVSIWERIRTQVTGCAPSTPRIWST